MQELSLHGLTMFMDANYQGATGQRKRFDRLTMSREWPVSFKVLGKDAPDGRFMSVVDAHVLFVNRLLPDRLRF